MKSCLSIMVGVLLLLSHLAVVIAGIVVATDISHLGKWGFFAGTVVAAVIITAVFRLLGHRTRDAYDVLDIFNW